VRGESLRLGFPEVRSRHLLGFVSINVRTGTSSS
jgi:hypothetical protein